MPAIRSTSSAAHHRARRPGVRSTNYRPGRGDRARLRLHHLQVSTSEQGAADFLGRLKRVSPAVGRIPRTTCAWTGTIPRGKLPEALAGIRELSQIRLRCGQLFHAGDGNLHPSDPLRRQHRRREARAEAFGADILRCAVKLGGVLTGGTASRRRKRDLMPEMSRHRPHPAAAPEMRVRTQACSIRKVFPVLHRCASSPRPCPWRPVAFPGHSRF